MSYIKTQQKAFNSLFLIFLEIQQRYVKTITLYYLSIIGVNYLTSKELFATINIDTNSFEDSVKGVSKFSGIKKMKRRHKPPFSLKNI